MTKRKYGYKGDFLIKKKEEEKFFVVECKGLKTNSEFRSANTDADSHLKQITKDQAFKALKKFINPNKEKIYQKGLEKYIKTKEKWEENHPGKVFPQFNWSHETPGADNVDLTNFFGNKENLKKFIEKSNEDLLTEQAFREKKALYRILQTHEPSDRTDLETGIHQAAPLVSDFSIMAVDLFQRTGKHEFVFMNPDKISHSPSSPNHLYQNYIIDVIIPGVKDNLIIKKPWFDDIDKCIIETNPKTVEYDASQIDYREA